MGLRARYFSLTFSKKSLAASRAVVTRVWSCFEPRRARKPFAGFGVVKGVKGAVEAEAGEAGAEVVGGGFGDAVGFVENDEVVGEEDAAGVGFGAGAGVDEGEKEAVVDDDQVGLADTGAGALEETGVGRAGFGVAGGGVGVDGLPDVVVGRRLEFLEEAVGGFEGPVHDTLEVVVEGAFEQVGAGLEGAGEALGAEVVGAADEDGGEEIGKRFKLGDGAEEGAADFEVFFEDLFLEGDGVGGDDEGAFGFLREEEAGEQVGEAFADAGAGLDDEGFVIAEGGGDGAGHAFLAGAVFELEGGLQPAVREEHFGDADFGGGDGLAGEQGGVVAGGGFGDGADHERRQNGKWKMKNGKEERRWESEVQMAKGQKIE